MLSPTKQSVLQNSSGARVRRYSRSRSAVHAMQVISASRYRPALRPAIHSSFLILKASANAWIFLASAMAYTVRIRVTGRSL